MWHEVIMEQALIPGTFRKLIKPIPIYWKAGMDRKIEPILVATKQNPSLLAEGHKRFSFFTSEQQIFRFSTVVS
jgi:hypothetical protein